jgi:hypothetical protein
MNEEQIERRVEIKIDRLDRAFLAGRITPETYNEEIRFIDNWAAGQYRHLRMAQSNSPVKLSR